MRHSVAIELRARGAAAFRLRLRGRGSSTAYSAGRRNENRKSGRVAALRGLDADGESAVMKANI